jgi:hypothetical protein
MKFLDVKWYCGSSNVGIVQVDFGDGIGYYIGSPPVIRSEQEDAEWIADWGSSFPVEVGDVLFGTDPIRTGVAVPIPKSREHAEAMVRVGQHYLENV